MNPHTYYRSLCLAVCAVFLFGCASGRVAEPVDTLSALSASRAAQPAAAVATEKTPAEKSPKERLPTRAESENAAPKERIAPTIVKGSDVMIGIPSSRGEVSGKGEAISLRFEQAPTTEVVHAVFGDLLKLDYAIVTPLTGEITLHTHSPVARDQVLGILESLLQANGISMVQDVAGRYRIGKSEVLKGAVPLPRRTTALPTGFGSVIVPLQYIGAAEMADILKPVASESALLRVDTVRNLLMLAGTRNQIEGWLEIVNSFDVDFLKGLSVGLFPLTYTSVKDVDAALKALLGGAASAGGAPGQAAGAAPGAARGDSKSVDAPLQMQGPLAGIVRVLPIERLNALLVVTARAHYLEQARIWIERFDRPTDSDADARLYVYPVQNGSAQHLASLLNGLYGNRNGSAATVRDSGAATSSTGPRTFDAFASTGFNSSFSGAAMGSGGSTYGSLGLGTGTLGRGVGNTQQQGSGPTTTQIDLGPDIRVVADDRNNALLIHASRQDYRRLEAALRQLDVAPVQVLIEASIVEVTLNDELKYGLQWYFEGSLGNGWKGLGQLTTGTTDAIGTVNPGFSYSVLNPAGSVRAVLDALAKKSLLNVISSPSIMVQDNHTAAIQVGNQQPVQSAVMESDVTVTSSIQYKDTGVMLSVTPSVNAGDMVSMQVNQSITDVGQIDTVTGQRAFLQRQLSSRVAVRSGQTIVLGGLIRDNKNRDRQGLPILHDIPVLGNLFGSTTIVNDRTELLVMITPRVVRTEQDTREVGDEIRERMRSLQGALRSPDVSLRMEHGAVPDVKPVAAPAAAEPPAGTAK